MSSNTKESTASSSSTEGHSVAASPPPMTFSKCMQSTIMTVKISPTDDALPEKFFLHSALLARESIYFQKILNGAFKETFEHETHLVADPDLFRHFAEFLYRGGWVVTLTPTKLPQHAFPFLARLYALGDRLQAPDVMLAVARKFTHYFHENTLPQSALCEVLRILCTELPRRSPEEGLRKFMFAYVADHLGCMRKWAAYQELLEEVPAMAQAVCSSVAELPAIKKEFLVKAKMLEEEKVF